MGFNDTILKFIDGRVGTGGRYIVVSAINVVNHQILLRIANWWWGWPGGWANAFAASTAMGRFLGHCLKQGLGVWMHRACILLVGRGDFHQLAQVHDCNPVRNMFNNRKIVGFVPIFRMKLCSCYF